MNKCTALCEVLDQYGAAVTRPSPLNFNDKALTLPLSFRRVRQAQRPRAPPWLRRKCAGVRCPVLIEEAVARVDAHLWPAYGASMAS